MSSIIIRSKALLFLNICGGYFITLVVITSIGDGISYYNNSSWILRASSLKVKQLKSILDYRGLSHTGQFEKRGLVDLVEGSGHLTSEEVTLAEDMFRKSVEGSSSDDSSEVGFPNNPRIWDEILKNDNRVFLVQIIGLKSHSRPLLDEKNWRKVVQNLEHLDIQTGVINCKAESSKKLCEREKWEYSRIVLVYIYSEGISYNIHRVLRNVEVSPSPADYVIHWLHKNLWDVVTVIPDIDDLAQNWLQMESRNNYRKTVLTPVHVVFVTHLSRPPSFLSALAVKYSGKIRFAMYTVEKGSTHEEEIKAKVGEIPSFVVVHSESGSTVIYGRRESEVPTYHCMNLYLRTIQLDSSDVLFLSQIVASILSTIEIFLTITDSPTNQTIKLITCLRNIVAYNAGVLVDWYVLRGVMGKSLSYVMWIAIGLSTGASFLRTSVFTCLRHPLYTVCTFLLYLCVCGYSEWFERFRPEPEARHISTFSRNFRVDQRRGIAERSVLDATLSVIRNRLQAFPPRPNLDIPDIYRRTATMSVEERMRFISDFLEEFIRSAALRPRISMEYLDDLPTWSYECDGDCPSEENEEPNRCVICLEEYKQGNTMCELPCKDSFHEGCIKKWIRGNNHVCPLCRRETYSGYQAINDE